MLRGWRDPNIKLWRIAVVSDEEQQSPHNSNIHGGHVVSLQAYSAYDLPSVEALVIFFHTAAGYSVKATWLVKAIKPGFYDA